MSINEFTDGELITAPRMNEMVGQLNTRYYVVDQAVGRTVKVWDYLNQREQMIYGDTGVRVVPMAAPWDLAINQQVAISRENKTVSVTGWRLSLPSGGGSGDVRIITLPQGFRPYDLGRITERSFRGKDLYADGLSGEVRMTNPGTPVDHFTLIFRTNDPWPTTLPGVAA